MSGNTLFDIGVGIWMAIAVVTFIILFKVTAPYGRHSTSTWGPLIPNKLGWIIMELPSPLIFAWFFLTGDLEKTIVAWIFFTCWMVHYINRSIIFPLRTRTAGKMMPLVITFSAIFFNAVNGSTNGLYLGSLGPVYNIEWLTDPRFIIGIILFAGGMLFNIQSDNILLNLRKPGETGYKIPQGGLFRYISCPNHFSETVEWLGFAIMTWSLPGLAFAVWTAANVIPRAVAHHKWYREKFADYPKDRKAVIPGVL
jgi:3-oxo-5-alpha-steroid 4-dehydrogenase 1